MRPTGSLHLGHYHGVLKNWVEMQQEFECLFFVADWHALTTHYDTPQVIEQSVWDMVIDWLAAGVDPARANQPRKTGIQIPAASPPNFSAHRDNAPDANFRWDASPIKHDLQT